jgi:diaminopimelate epimerase
MTKVHFSKYHGAGNDFILIDDRSGLLENKMNEAWIANLCHRRFGVGADGLILLQKGQDGADFFMRYYNSDGRISTFCGNGGRCIVSFAEQLGIHHGNTTFKGTDGWHQGELKEDGLIYLSMSDVNEINQLDENTYTLHTGSPHFVRFVDDLEKINVEEEGRRIRNSPAFAKDGINVNFVQHSAPSEIHIRTYERGVENETMACGTGVVAAAIAHKVHTGNDISNRLVHAQGGLLRVEFLQKSPHEFLNVTLIGPAVEVFRGEIELG